MSRVAFLSAALLVACPGHRRGIEPPVGSPEAVLATARGRVVPDPLRARFGIKLRSKPLDIAASTGGGLIVDRPGQGRLDVFGPMGGSVVTVATDGAGLSVLLMGPKRHLVATDAETVIRRTTGGAASLDDALAVLTGDLPFDDASVKDLAAVPPEDPAHPGLVYARLDGPKGVVIDVWLDPADATPREIAAVDKKGALLIRATYDAFEDKDGALLPTRVEVYFPALDLTVESKYRGWEVLDAPPESIVPATPDGFTVEPLEDAVKKLAEQRPAPEK